MESPEIKALRKHYGLMDETETVTKEQLLSLSQRKLYYIHLGVEDSDNETKICYKLVHGYISSDAHPVVFIKDKDITRRDDAYYHTMLSLAYCKEIKSGIYYESLKKIIICTDLSKLDFCINFMKSAIETRRQKDINDLHERINALKNMTITVTSL